MSSRKLGHWIQHSSLHLHLNVLCQYQKADNWVPDISRNASLLCLFRRKSLFFTVNGLWRDCTIILPNLPLFPSDMCDVLSRRQQVAIKYECYVFSCPIVVQQIVFEGLTYFIKRASNSPWTFLQQ